MFDAQKCGEYRLKQAKRRMPIAELERTIQVVLWWQTRDFHVLGILTELETMLTISIPFYNF